MAIDNATLKTEILTDPNGYGYATPLSVGNLGVVADLINEVRAGITVRRINVDSQTILQAIDIRDFKASPSNAECAWFESATRQAAINLLNEDGSDTQVAGNFRRLFGNTNGTLSRFQTICTRNGSRGEQLFGAGTFISWEQVKAALAS